MFNLLFVLFNGSPPVEYDKAVKNMCGFEDAMLGTKLSIFLYPWDMGINGNNI